MGIHTVRSDCLKCNTRESLVFSCSTKEPFYIDAFCLNCGWSYRTAEGKIDKQELGELRKEYEWNERD